MVEQAKLNGIRLTIAVLAGLIIVAGWQLHLTSRIGKMEGNDFTSHDGFRIESRIEKVGSGVDALRSRVSNLEDKVSPPKEVTLQLDRLNSAVDLMKIELNVISRSLIVIENDHKRLVGRLLNLRIGEEDTQ
jgi:hypothetical protein